MRPLSLPSRPSRLLIIATLLCLLSGLLPAPPPAAAAPTYTLSISATGGGQVEASPPGPTYPAGTTVTLTARPAGGSVLLNWSLDGTAVGWAPTLTITMDADHGAVATFAPRPLFSDVPTSSVYYRCHHPTRGSRRDQGL